MKKILSRNPSRQPHRQSIRSFFSGHGHQLTRTGGWDFASPRGQEVCRCTLSTNSANKVDSIETDYLSTWRTQNCLGGRWSWADDYQGESGFAIIGKFLYGCPVIQDLRKVIPKQYELKGECNIGLLSNRHVLIRASFLEDYVNQMSKPAFYLMISGWSYTILTLKWEHN